MNEEVRQLAETIAAVQSAQIEIVDAIIGGLVASDILPAETGGDILLVLAKHLRKRAAHFEDMNRGAFGSAYRTCSDAIYDRSVKMRERPAGR